MYNSSSILTTKVKTLRSLISELDNMSKSDFNFAVLRITIMQILKAIGFERCAPRIVDILTDIYIRHLRLLASEAQSLSNACGRDDISIQDITQALQNIGMIKPTNLLDIFDQYDGENKSAQNFLYWVVGQTPEKARVVSKPSLEMLESQKVKRNPVIPEYINALNGQEVNQEVEEVINEEDWLKFMMTRGNKVGHEEMFKHTILNDKGLTDSEYKVTGDAPNEIMERLPYNVAKKIKEEDGLILEENGHITNGYENTSLMQL